MKVYYKLLYFYVFFFLGLQLCQQERKVQNLTERLESTHREITSLKSQIDGQMRNNASTALGNELENLRMLINSTAETTSYLIVKVPSSYHLTNNDDDDDAMTTTTTTIMFFYCK